MSQTKQEVLTVDEVTQYGIKYNGKTYSISTRLAQSGVTPQHFQVGSRIRAEIWTGPQGGKKINSFQPEGASPYQAPALPPMPPAAPSLPMTSVAATPAPGGVAPVARAGVNGNGASPTADEKMSKADWAARNHEIAVQAILKSSIESPALAEHVTGKSTPEVFQLQREYFKANLELYRLALAGLL